MSYLDDLASGTLEANDPSSPTASVLSIVCSQIEDGKFDAFMESETLFKVSDIGFGAGFAEGVITLDEASGLCGFDINAHIAVPVELSKGADRFCRHLNSQFITRGFVLVDGTVHFINEIPVDVRCGGNISDEFSRAMSSIHRHAEDFSLIRAGVDPWEIVEASKKKQDDEADRLAELRRMLEIDD